MNVYPATEGLIVRDPDKRDVLPEEGRDVDRSMYWLRRVRAGDVVTEAPAWLLAKQAAATSAEAASAADEAAATAPAETPDSSEEASAE